MPNFADPICCGVTEFSETELKSKIQQCIADEYEAASRYRKIADVCKDKRVKEIMNDVAEEEIIHVGEFHKLLSVLFPNETELEADGEREAEKKISWVVDAEKEGDEDEDEDEGEEGKSDEGEEGKSDEGEEGKSDEGEEGKSDEGEKSRSADSSSSERKVRVIRIVKSPK